MEGPKDVEGHSSAIRGSASHQLSQEFIFNYSFCGIDWSCFANSKANNFKLFPDSRPEIRRNDGLRRIPNSIPFMHLVSALTTVMIELKISN